MYSCHTEYAREYLRGAVVELRSLNGVLFVLVAVCHWQMLCFSVAREELLEQQRAGLCSPVQGRLHCAVSCNVTWQSPSRQLLAILRAM